MTNARIQYYTPYLFVISENTTHCKFILLKLHKYVHPPPIEPSIHQDSILDRGLANVLHSSSFLMTDSSSFIIPLAFSYDDSQHRGTRDSAQILTKLLKNLIYNSTVPLPSES